jgi:glycine betaine/proline transport system permease protein
MKWRIDIGGAFESVINWLTNNFDGFFDAISDSVSATLDLFDAVLQAPHPLLLTAILMALA